MPLANALGVSPKEVLALTLLWRGQPSAAISEVVIQGLLKKGLIDYSVNNKGKDVLNMLVSDACETRPKNGTNE